MTNESTLKLFLETQLKNDSSKVLNALKRLSPIHLNLDNLIHLYEWIQDNYSVSDFNYPHINIFGTGGDKTVNISTISSIVASKYIDVIKIGTRAVTSKWGSFEFVSSLKNSSSYFGEKSRYIGLSELGYHYSKDLLKARQELRKEGILDIYKLVFPLINFTGSSAQVNGVHRIEYLNYYMHIYKELSISGIIIYNENDIDEIYFGRNYLFCFKDGSLLRRITIDIEPSRPEDLDYFKESDDIYEHVNKFHEILENKVSSGVRKVIDMNVASMIMASKLFADSLDKYYSEISDQQIN